MTTSAGPVLQEIYDEYHDRVDFLSLYVREAHPGDHYPQPETFEQKLRHACNYKERRDVAWPVAVDDIDGALHTQLDPRPHAAYVMGTDGNVAGRALWANDGQTLRRLLDAALAGDRLEITNHLVPMLRGTGCMYQVWSEAGGHAKTDVLKQAPPMYLSGWLAARLGPFPPLARGAAAMTATMLAPGLGAKWLWNRRPSHST